MRKDPALTLALIYTTAFIGLLWLIKLLELALGVSLSGWGIEPRTLWGLVGIGTMPFLHGSVAHLFSNTLPLLLLGTALIYAYPKSRWPALVHIWLISGIGVWLLGRPSTHIGASGLAHGLFFFLLTMGLLRRDKRAMALLMAAFFLYGSMLLTVLPGAPGVSFEGHAFGALGGILAAIRYRRYDPSPPRQRYDWESEPDTDDERPLSEEDLIELARARKARWGPHS